MSGYDGLVYSFLGCAEFFRILPWSGSEKKTSKISFEKFGVNEKVLTFAAAFRNEADVLKHFDGSVFHLLGMKPAEAFFCGGSEKKFEKKCGKIWRGCVKLFIFASAFAPGSGRVK